jgi:predicted protein tyrosine phosphatase
MELGPFINNAADWLGESSIVAAVFDNPIYTAIFMTIIVVIIFYFSRESFARPAAKTLVALLAIMFVYHRRFEKRHERERRANDITHALAVPSTIVGPDTVAITPSVPAVYM